MWSILRSFIRKKDVHKGAKRKTAASSKSAPAPAPAPSKVSGTQEPAPAPDFKFLDLREYPQEPRPQEIRYHPSACATITKIASAAQLRFERYPDDVPAMPTMAAQILSLLGNEDLRIEQLIARINRDPRIASQILKAANSPAFRGEREMYSMRDCVVRMGLQHAGNVAAAASIGGLFAMGSTCHPLLTEAGQDLWRRAMICAQTSAAFSMHLRIGRADQLFLGGMLHDIGKAVALRSVATNLDEALLNRGDSALILAEVLEELHLDFGEQVAKIWGLPANIAIFCSDHHSPREQDRDVHLVRLASGMNEMRSNPNSCPGVLGELEESRKVLDIDETMMRLLSTEMRDAAQRVATMSQH